MYKKVSFQYRILLSSSTIRLKSNKKDREKSIGYEQQHLSNYVKNHSEPTLLIETFFS